MSMYYSNAKILSYNKLFNFIVGNRGGGKSFNAKEWCIRSFLKSGAQFIYVRRYKTELEHITEWFSDIRFLFPEHKLEVKGRSFLIDGKVAGYAVPLSTSQKEKSTSYPDVDKIIFDEFIIEETTYHYLKNEVKMFLDFYETVARMRDVRVEFISNAITIGNPYFLYFNIYPRPNSKFTVGNEWVCEMYKGEEFTNAKKETRFGRLIAGSAYAEYSIENKFMLDNDEFIGRMAADSKPCFTVVYEGRQYGIWYSVTEAMYYMNTKPMHSMIYTLSTSDHRPNNLLIENIKSHPLFKNLKKAYSYGQLTFDSLKTKQAFYHILNLL